MATTPPLPELPYTTVDAFKLAGHVYETEREVLVAAIAAVLERTDKVSPADGVYEAGSAILPLLQRAIAVRSAELVRDLAPPPWPDRNGFDTTPRTLPDRPPLRPVTEGERLAAEAVREDLVELEQVEGLFLAEHSDPVYNFLKRWRRMDVRLFSPISTSGRVRSSRKMPRRPRMSPVISRSVHLGPRNDRRARQGAPRSNVRAPRQRRGRPQAPRQSNARGDYDGEPC